MKNSETWKRQKWYLASKLFSERLCQDLKIIPKPPEFIDIDLEGGQGLFLYGPVKTGKTVYAAQLVLDIQRQWWLQADGRGILFSSAPRIFRELKASFDKKDNKETEHEIMSRYENIDLLVLDDLGMNGKVSEWLLEILYVLIDYRWEHLKPTIITSNKSLPELADQFGDDRITSRIERMCKIVKKTPYDKGL